MSSVAASHDCRSLPTMLLTVAAVVGRDFDLASVIAAGGFDRDDALDGLDAAIRPVWSSRYTNSPGHFSFSHALVRQTLPRRSAAPPARAPALARSERRSRSKRDRAALGDCVPSVRGGARRRCRATRPTPRLQLPRTRSPLPRPTKPGPSAQRAIGVLDDANADEPELRCRALLVTGETAAAMQLDFAAARAALSKPRISPNVTAGPSSRRAATVYSFSLTPGAFDPVVEGPGTRRSTSAPAHGSFRFCRRSSACSRSSPLNQDDGSTLIDEAVAAADRHEGLGLTVALVSRSTADWGCPDRVQLAGSTDSRSTWRSRSAVRRGSQGRERRGRLSVCVPEIAARERNMMRSPRSATDTRSPTLSSARSIAPSASMTVALRTRERIAVEAVANLDPASGAWLNATVQLAATWYWCGRDEELITGLAAFPEDAAPQKYLLDLVRIHVCPEG